MIDANQIDEFRELVNNNAVLKKSEILELLESHEELDCKLFTAEFALKSIQCTTKESESLSIIYKALKLIRGEE